MKKLWALTPTTGDLALWSFYCGALVFGVPYFATGYHSAIMWFESNTAQQVLRLRRAGLLRGLVVHSPAQ